MQVLDLGGVRVEPADDEHVLDAPDDAQVAVGVERAEVARVQPAVGVDRGRGRLGVVEVARASPSRRARRPRPAPRSRRRRPTRSRCAPRSRATATPTVVAMCSKSSSGRQPVTVPASVSPYPVRMRSNGSSSRTRRISSTGMSAAPVTADAQARDVAARAVGMVEQRVVDRRRPGEHRDPLALDDLEHDTGVEHREREDRRAAHEAREAPGLVAEDVEERVRDQVAVAGAQVGPVAPVEVRAQRLAVRHHDALGVPGGARREHDVARIVGADRRDARVELGGGHRAAARDEVVPGDRRAVGLTGEQDRVLERGQRRRRRPRAAPGSRCRGTRAP